MSTVASSVNGSARARIRQDRAERRLIEPAEGLVRLCVVASRPTVAAISENGDPSIRTHSAGRSSGSYSAHAPGGPLHDLRQTHVSLALKVGVRVKVVSERLGHESPGFTLKQYAHVLPGMQAEAAGAIAALIADDGGEDPAQ